MADGTSRRGGEASRRGGEASRRGEVLWPIEASRRGEKLDFT